MLCSRGLWSPLTSCDGDVSCRGIAPHFFFANHFHICYLILALRNSYGVGQTTVCVADEEAEASPVTLDAGPWLRQTGKNCSRESLTLCLLPRCSYMLTYTAGLDTRSSLIRKTFPGSLQNDDLLITRIFLPGWDAVQPHGARIF